MQIDLTAGAYALYATNHGAGLRVGGATAELDHHEATRLYRESAHSLLHSEGFEVTVGQVKMQRALFGLRIEIDGRSTVLPTHDAVRNFARQVRHLA